MVFIGPQVFKTKAANDSDELGYGLLVPASHGGQCVGVSTGLVAQLAEHRAWYPKVLGSIPTFSTKHVTCLSPAVGGLK